MTWHFIHACRFMLGEGPLAEQWSQLVHVGCRKAGLDIRMPPLGAAAFRRVESGQGELR